MGLEPATSTFGNVAKLVKRRRSKPEVLVSRLVLFESFSRILPKLLEHL